MRYLSGEELKLYEWNSTNNLHNLNKIDFHCECFQLLKIEFFKIF